MSLASQNPARNWALRKNPKPPEHIQKRGGMWPKRAWGLHALADGDRNGPEMDTWSYWFHPSCVSPLTSTWNDEIWSWRRPQKGGQKREEKGRFGCISTKIEGGEWEEGRQEEFLPPPITVKGEGVQVKRGREIIERGQKLSLEHEEFLSSSIIAFFFSSNHRIWLK